MVRLPVTVQILGRTLSVAWTEPFLFCRRTDARTAAALEAGPRQRLNTSAVRAELGRIAAWYYGLTTLYQPVYAASRRLSC